MGKPYLSCRIKHTNPKSPIAYFKIVAVREHKDYDGDFYIDEVTDDDDFYLYEDLEIFYHVYGERYIDDKRSGTIFLGEFSTIDKAQDFVYYITGEIPDILSY